MSSAQRRRRRSRRRRQDVADGVFLVVLNLPVPDDRRVWAEACALRDAGHRVVVICPALRGHRPGIRPVEGVEVHYFRTAEGNGVITTLLEGLWNTIAASFWLVRLAGPGASAVQVCNPPDAMAPMLRWARRRGARTIYDQHDAVPVLATERGWPRALQALLRRMERSTVAASHAILTPSHQQRARIKELFGRDAVVVPTAAPVASHVAVTSPRSENQTVRLGYLGVIGKQDGVEDLIDAVALAAKFTDRPFVVHIAGDGPALADVREAADARGVLDMVVFEGWLDSDGVSEFLARIDAMVVPDAPTAFNHLCAMNKVTHAMAAGVPVVCRPLNENQELIGDHGFVAWDDSVEAFADAIAAFLSTSPEDAAHSGDALRRRHRMHLDWSVHRERYVSAVMGRADQTGRV